MSFTLWFLLVGGLFIAMALFGSVLKRLPLTNSMFYLGVGVLLGPALLGVISVDPIAHAAVLERVTEVAVIISLFGAGLRLRTPLSDWRWLLPARLAFGSMLLTVGMVTLAGTALLGLPLGAAVLLGAILAPTDPVLASDVQVEHPGDQDRLRFGLTGEAGLNDGSAFPFVMLGLGLLGLHELGELGWRWLAVDVVWAVLAGLAVGGLLGTGVGRLVIYLRRIHREAVGLDDFLALGLIALAYGAALLVSAYGFLAVFAAGLALRRVEQSRNADKSFDDVASEVGGGADEQAATDPGKAEAYMTQAVLGFNEQLERIGEIGVVLLLGSMLVPAYLTPEALWFVPLLLLLIRPAAVLLGLLGTRTSGAQRGMMAWFGVRGVGSVYYLMYAIEHGLPPDLAERLTGLTFATVAASVVVHGISVTPLMRRYSRQETDDDAQPDADQRPPTADHQSRLRVPD